MIKISVIFNVFLFLFTSCISSTRSENAENIKSVHLEMKDKDVKEIMGAPVSTIVLPRDEKRYSYLYEAPIGYSDDFYIFFDRVDSLVVEIRNGK